MYLTFLNFIVENVLKVLNFGVFFYSKKKEGSEVLDFALTQ